LARHTTSAFLQVFFSLKPKRKRKEETKPTPEVPSLAKKEGKKRRITPSMIFALGVVALSGAFSKVAELGS